MKIGIDISQIAHEGTGVATYVRNIVAALVHRYPEHEYIFIRVVATETACFC